MLEPPNIPEEHLRACLQEQYGLAAVTLEFLPIGLDSRAGVYRVMTVQGTAYLLKAKSGTLYEPSCIVPRYLKDQGVDAVVAPVPTNRNALWTQLGEWEHEDWTAIVYPFIEGDVGWNPRMTEAQWKAVGTAIKWIHQVPLRPEGFQSLRKETFDPTEYGRWVRAFDADNARAAGGGEVEQAFRAHWMEHRPTIFRLVTMMEGLAGVLQRQAEPHVICHADLHPSNIIRGYDGRVFIIDWDDVMLAPKERDFLFVGDPPSDTASRERIAPFFQGYWQVEIDWVALTYYRCERVVTDVIECGQEVFFRNDLGVESKAYSAQLFGRLFAVGSMVDAVWAAADHLPPSLAVRGA